jgi:arylformamidase
MTSQSELDAAFTLDTVRDLDALLTRRAAAAATAYTQFPVIRAIPYGPGEGETFHLFVPRSASGLAPVEIFIHGGFWMSMEAEQFSFLARGFVPFGAALVVIDYPLIPTLRMAGIVDACRRAVTYVHRHGSEHGLDSARMFIAGNSAGGHLVAELMDRRWTREAGLPDDVIKGGTSVSGLFDLRPVAASFRNESLQFTPEEVARFSPLLRRPEIRSPTIVAVGGDETGEFLRQSEDFAQLVRSMGAPVEHIVVAGTNHITVVLDALADPDAPLNRAVRRQIGV